MQNLLISWSHMFPLTVIVLNIWAVYWTIRVGLNIVVFVVSFFTGLVNSVKESEQDFNDSGVNDKDDDPK